MSTSAARQGHRSPGPRRTVMMLGCVLVLALGACGSGVGKTGTQPDRPATATSRATTGQQPEAGGDTSKAPKSSRDAVQARDRFTGALQGGLADGIDPSREQIVYALAAAGFDEAEVSIDTTPTGLEVKAIEAAVRFDGECLVGQSRGGALSATVLPVLASGHCFVGDQR